jgi:nicotinamidase-related amidase
MPMGRTGFNGFIDSDLLTQLHDAGAQRVLFAGIATDQCVGRT